MKYFLIPIECIIFISESKVEHYLDQMFPELSKYCNQRMMLNHLSGVPLERKEFAERDLTSKINQFVLENHVPKKLLFVQKKEGSIMVPLEEYFTNLEIFDFHVKVKYYEVSKKQAEEYLQGLTKAEKDVIEDTFRNFVCGFSRRKPGKTIVFRKDTNGRNSTD